MGALTTCKDFVSHPHLVETVRTFKDKDGKVKQDCKKIKVHKKFEGTEIPADKKK